ncbi:MAG TPA: DUF4347 domain-containing protein [Leptolyngbyaceae cyanobacterium]
MPVKNSALENYAMKAAQGNAIAFIDTSIPDWQTLAAGVAPGTEIFILDGTRDGVEQITQILQTRSQIAALHIISHGSPGNVQLGNTWLNLGNIENYALQLIQWRSALIHSADILIYGCNVAADSLAPPTHRGLKFLANSRTTLKLTENLLLKSFLTELSGRDAKREPISNSFIQHLAALTGANIAASKNPTGSAALGGDWKLEVTTGAIATNIVFLPATIARYSAVLGNTTRVSVNSSGIEGNSYSQFPSISANGRYVVFQSGASNLVSDDTNNAEDFFVRDMLTNTTTRVSVDSMGNQGNAQVSLYSSISADGRYVAFSSGASNLVSGDTNGTTDVFVRDTLTNTTTRVSLSSSGIQGGGDVPSISADGRYVAFMSSASNLVSGDTNGWDDIFLRDTFTNTTTRVSVDSMGNQGNFFSEFPSISGNGRYVAFRSYASNLVSGDTNNKWDIFVRDTLTNTTTRVSVDSMGNQGNADSQQGISISADGRYVAFNSAASNLVSGDTNGASDIFVRDTLTNTTTRVSVDSMGNQANSSSFYPFISADGRYVTFRSTASNLVSGGTNGTSHIFVRDTLTNTTTLVSVDSMGNQGNGFSQSASISADGRYVAFYSDATNLVSGDTNNSPDIFVRDNSSLPAVSITVSDPTATESPTDPGKYTISRTSSTGALTVKLTIDANSGASASDYNLSVSTGTINIASSNIEVVIPDGVASVDVTLTPNDDIHAEADETLKLNLTPDAAYINDAVNNNGIVTIAANDTVVINTKDSGEGSLRQAIINANTITGKDTITFNISGTGPHTISPTSALPTITEAVVIDGYSQPGASKNTLAAGNNAQLKIILDGTNAGSSISGLNLSSSSNGSTIQGLTINKFQGVGIYLESKNNLVVGNFLGTDATGTIDLGNTLDGMYVAGSDNIIGGSNAGDRNIISGNDRYGIVILDSATNNQVQGNYIGTDVSGTLDLGNTKEGVFITGSNNIIGGSNAGDRNIISGNDRSGLFMSNTNNKVQGNYIGTDVTGTLDLGNTSYGMYITGSNNIIGGSNAGDRNIISSNDLSAIFLAKSGTNNKVQGNYIGTDATGTIDLGNTLEGVYVEGSSNIIGGSNANDRNIISGNDRYGIGILDTATNNQVQGNYIGTDVTGTLDLGNTKEGVFITGSNNIIGGSNAGDRNIISGNDRSGLFISNIATNNKVQGNYIGTDATGTLDLGNTSYGMYVAGSDNIIGGSNAGDRNIISGNDEFGIGIYNTNNKVQGNYIGTDVSGTLDLGNTKDGVLLSASDNIIGGSNASDRNIISGNGGSGIGIVSGNNQVRGNYIGTKIDGVSALGNTLFGIYIDGNQNAIGGTNTGEGNIISSNALEGILIVSGTGNSIQGNSIFSNSRLGIDLGKALPGNGVTPNDTGDGDTDANNLQNFPVLTYAEIAGSNTACTGTFNSTANTNFRLEFFANDVLDASGNGEGKTYLGFANITTDGDGNANFTVTNLAAAPLGNYVTATATNLTTNDTSEFSNGVIIDTPIVSLTPVSITKAEGNSGTTDYTFTATLSRATTQTVTVNYSTKDGTATIANNDYIDNDNSITFTPGGSLTQTITIQAKGDETPESDETFTVSLDSATNAQIDTSAKQGTGTITNDDKAGIIVTQNPGLTTTETGGTATFTIKLASQPTSDVTINLASDNTKEGITDKSSLTFTSANWNLDQTVTIIGQDDFIIDGNISYNIITAKSTSADTSYNNLDVTDVPVINTDNEKGGITINQSGGNTNIIEGGATDSYEIVLTSQPTSDVTISINNSTQTGTSPTTLTFTSANWNIARTVTITAIDDNAEEGNHTGTITHTVTSSDANYNGFTIADITANISDNDSAGFTINPTTLTTGENGTTANFSVKLNTQPTADVTLNLSSSNTAEGTIDKSSLTFTTSNWNTPQTVTIIGIDDNIVDGDKVYQVITNAAISNDSKYNNLNPVDINVTNTDNDRTTVSVTPATVSQTEGNGGAIAYNFTINLSHSSVVPVTVAYTTDDGTATAGSDYIDNDGTIAFNPGETSKSITVNVLGDNLPETSETFSINLVSATNATVNSTSKQSTGIITNDDTQDSDCFCKSIVRPDINNLPGVSVALNSVENTQLVSEYENSLTDSNGNDALFGNGEDDLLLGKAGNDNLSSSEGNDTAFGGSERDWISGNEGDDLLNGNEGNDVLNGNQGNDTVRGGQGNDLVRGGQNDDLIYGDIGNDTLGGDKGNDTIFGDRNDTTNSAGQDLIFGGSGDDLINGNAGNDSIFGEDGNDTVCGGKDDDILFGDVGDDRLYGDLGNDSLCGSSGNDTIYGGIGSVDADNSDRDEICGGSGKDLLFGNEGEDKLNGEEGDDSLYGGKNNDHLIGGAGNDLLSGDFGNDLLTGGSGNDIFVLASEKGSDLITDFQDGQDAIALSSGLSFADLAIVQSNNNTIVIVKASNELLANLHSIPANLINQQDFIFIS